MKAIKLNPGNIFSGDRCLAVFTNPTCLAKKKGNLKFDYPVIMDEVRYSDAEAAYQDLAAGCKANYSACRRVCVMVLEAKLKQYPVLLRTIKMSGGLDWIKQCRHIVFARTKAFKRWEGYGLESGFIACLYVAYRNLKGEI
jgi:hypothetical protein